MGIVCAPKQFASAKRLGLKWKDIDSEQLLFHVTRSVVDGVVGKCETETSRKAHRSTSSPSNAPRSGGRHLFTPCRRVGDFASEWQDGKMPPWADTLLDRYLQPAAKVAGITKRVGWQRSGTPVRRCFM
jgi:hypothetical protein